MKILSGPYEGWDVAEEPAAVAVGVFDGVHRGHQALLERLREKAAGLPLVALTFARHPDSVVDPARSLQLLTPPAQRAGLLADLGVDVVAHLEFDESMRRMPAADFVRHVLVGTLQSKVIAVGGDFRFGRDGTGDVTLLQTMGEELGYEVVLVPLVGGEEPVSSTRIRAHLRSGDVEEAAALLGRPYAVRGLVEAGQRRGRSIGVPTANIGLDPSQLLPGKGVYAVEALVAGSKLAGAANVGSRPTFDGVRTIVEVHLLDFDGDLYGQEMSVGFLHRIRDEMKFEGVDELVSQIHADIARVRLLLGGDGAPSGGDDPA